MIDADYVRLMARYNSWQNAQLMPVIEAMPLEELTRDRGAFFGSILATANHLLWGDTIWLSRFDPSVAPPDVSGEMGLSMHPTGNAWAAARFRMDGLIRKWADGVRSVDLKGELTFRSVVMGRNVSVSKPKAVIGVFMHQTHHRGQIHAMLTAAGQTAPVTDLIFMPEDV